MAINAENVSIWCRHHGKWSWCQLCRHWWHQRWSKRRLRVSPCSDEKVITLFCSGTAKAFRKKRGLFFVYLWIETAFLYLPTTYKQMWNEPFYRRNLGNTQLKIFNTFVNSSPPSAVYTSVNSASTASGNGYLNRCWRIVNRTHRNNIQWNSNQNAKLFFHIMHLKMLSTKWRSFCPGWDELTQ